MDWENIERAGACLRKRRPFLREARGIGPADPHEGDSQLKTAAPTDADVWEDKKHASVPVLVLELLKRRY